MTEEWGKFEATLITNGEIENSLARTYSLVKDDLIIGRKKDCDIMFDRPEISRIHMELHRVMEAGHPDHYYVVDKSRNGVWINKVKVTEKNVPKEIFSGDDISLVNPDQEATLKVEIRFISYHNHEDDDEEEEEKKKEKGSFEDGTVICDEYDEEKEEGAEKGGRFEDKYVMCEELGSGSFGDVWKAQSKATGEYVAVKKIGIAKILKARPKLGLEGAIKFIKNEFSIMSELDHKNIIKVIESFENDPKFIYIVLEM